MGPPTGKEAPGGEQLLPGIPNEISLDRIAPKVSLGALPILSFVSRAWEEAIRTNRNRIHAARVRANSTETLIIHRHAHDDRDATALYFASEDRCYEIPPLPCVSRGVLDFCECIALDGKIYVLGGLEVLGGERVLKGGRVVSDSGGHLASGEVYVLDLVGGQRKWERCASMLEPRCSFGSGVIDDKIYVFGGKISVSDQGFYPMNYMVLSEVYDTQKNAWSPISPIHRQGGFTSKPIAVAVGKEFFLYDRYPRIFSVYNPAKDQWTHTEHFWGQCPPRLVFVAEGKVHSFSQSGIDIYDAEQRSWINRHTNSFAALQPDDSTQLLAALQPADSTSTDLFASFLRYDSTQILPLAISAAKDKLFLTAYGDIGENSSSQSYYCKGFDSENKELVWQKTNCSFKKPLRRGLQFPIQL